jgi:hypothetical protein
LQAVGKLVDPRIETVAGNAEQLGSMAAAAAHSIKPWRPVVEYPRCMAKRLDIVHHGRIAQITAINWKRRTGLGFARQPFAGTDQRAFLAADIGPGPHLDAHIEIEAIDAHDLLAEKPARAAVLKNAFEKLAQIDIFAPEIDKPFGCPNRFRRDGHAFDQQMRPLSQQHPVLERTGFTLVSITEHIAPLGGRAGGKPPFLSGRESRPAAAAKATGLDGVDDLEGRQIERLFQPGIVLNRPEQHRARMPDIVVHHAGGAFVGGKLGKAIADQLLRRLPGFERSGNFTRLVLGQAGNDNIVDHCGGCLVAHTYTGRIFQRECAIARGMSHFDAEFVFKRMHHVGQTRKAVDDVITKADCYPAPGRQREEGIKTCDAFHGNSRQTGLPGNDGHDLGRYAPVLVLHFAKDIQHRRCR